MQPFVHLHVHSQYSLLDGQASIPKLVDKAMGDGMRGIALTDHGAMYGIKEFYNYVNGKNKALASEIKTLRSKIQELEAAEANPKAAALLVDLRPKLEALEGRYPFKPILGCEAYCARRTRHDKDAKVPDPYKPNRPVDYSGWHIVLLAKNEVGYRNLIKMVSISWTEGYYQRPRIDKELLERYHEGIIVSTACLGGEIPQHIMAGNIAAAEESILWFKDLFGDDFYLEVQRHQTNNPRGNMTVYEEQVRVNRVILELGERLGVKVIATNDCHFVNEEDAEAHDRLICLSTGKDVNDHNRMVYSKQEWLKTTAEMNAIFSDIPEVLTNTLEILDKVELYSIDHEALMPDFPIPDGFEDADAYLRHLTYEGAKRKYTEQGMTPELCERIDFELETIRKMGFPGYFLIVQDFIAAARAMGVFVGPGRGSAAGSAVAYCLNITDIDPIKYDLLFERFLNPDRISMPDIDIDFDDDGRADILRWVTEKYGKERVAHIITYGTMATKSSIRDVARVQGLELRESDRLAKLIPDKIPEVKKVTLKEAIEYVPELKQASLSSNPLLSETLKYAQALEGNVRNTGVHACGIIIGKTPISDIVPISTAKDKDGGEDLLVTQYEGSVIEETGLIKMDFLGLKTLSILKETLANIKQRHGIDLDIDHIPLDDPKTYELYSQGRTVGTFQFESVGMQRYLRELQPTTFADLIAMSALYRPGPLDYIPEFVARKHGRSPITYDLPCMERYLHDTYGITVYQEQVMLLSREIAGFTRGESDNLRKAMGKKLEDKMAALRTKFVEGGKANGHPVATLEKIWSDWAKFASYAFNKSHATCYSWVAYQTAYLKANYPSEYMAGALSRNLSNIVEITKLMDECKALNIRVLVPDVNESREKFSVNASGDIRFGLNGVKGTGSSGIEEIIRCRDEGGVYTDIYNFFERVNLSLCNKKTLEALIYAGGFDSLGIAREVYFQPMSDGREETFLGALIRYGDTLRREREVQESSLFGQEEEALQLPRPLPPLVKEPLSEIELLNRERELVGLYLSSSPLAPYSVILSHYCTANATDLSNIYALGEGKSVIAGGVVAKAYQGLTKKGQPFGRLSVEDMTGVFEFSLFSDNYLRLAPYFKEGLFVLIRGAIVSRPYSPGDLELAVHQIELLPEVKDTLISKVDLSIPLESLSHELVEELEEVLSNNRGSAMLSIQVVDKPQHRALSFAYDAACVSPTAELLSFCQQRGIEFDAK